MLAVTCLAHAMAWQASREQSFGTQTPAVTRIEVAVISDLQPVREKPKAQAQPPSTDVAPAIDPLTAPPANEQQSDNQPKNNEPERVASNDSKAESKTDSKTDSKADPTPTPPPTQPPRPGATLPGSTTLVYDVTLGEQGAPVGKVVYDLSINNQRYDLKIRGEAVGIAALFYAGLWVEHSQGTVAADGFHPQRYSEQRGKRPETYATMFPATQEVQFGEDPNRRAYPLGLQDRLTMLFQLGSLARAASDQAGGLHAGQPFEMAVASTNDIETIRFKYLGQAAIEIGDKTEQAWHFEKVVSKPFQESQIDAWFSPSKLWLPVQIKVTDKKGITFVQRLH